MNPSSPSANTHSKRKQPSRRLSRAMALLLLLAVTALGLQIYFILRVLLMQYVNVQSTSFQRSEMWRIVNTQHGLLWNETWQDLPAISANLQRAVIASEDGEFTDHWGIDWNAIEAAWDRNAKASAAAEKLNQARAMRNAKKQKNKPAVDAKTPVNHSVAPKLVGGSTITQQLAKNLFLSGERSLLRKGQEFIITFALELFLSKRRILELYLNNVEWGEGIFGAEAAARYYFHKPASALGAYEAARLAVMLPRPRYFEKNPNTAFIAGRSATIVGRMKSVELP